MNNSISPSDHQRRVLPPLLFACAVVASSPVAAVEQTSADAGLRYASGGIGLSERNAMYTQRGQYRLWVATVARGSGAYLANAHVRITPAAGGEPILEHTMDGPWLFVDLPPGRYTVAASLDANGSQPPLTQRVQTQVESSGLSQAVLRFPVRTEVSPDRAQPFDGNPFGEVAKR